MGTQEYECRRWLGKAMDCRGQPSAGRLSVRSPQIGAIQKIWDPSEAKMMIPIVTPGECVEICGVLYWIYTDSKNLDFGPSQCVVTQWRQPD